MLFAQLLGRYDQSSITRRLSGLTVTTIIEAGEFLADLIGIDMHALVTLRLTKPQIYLWIQGTINRDDFGLVGRHVQVADYGTVHLHQDMRALACRHGHFQLKLDILRILFGRVEHRIVHECQPEIITLRRMEGLRGTYPVRIATSQRCPLPPRIRGGTNQQ